MAQNIDPIKKEEKVLTSIPSNNENIDTSNIFSGFTNSGLKAEVDEIIESQKKDIFYYLKNITALLKIFFGLSVLFFIITYTYIFVQEKPDLSNSSMLDPFCFIILGNIKNSDNTYCSSISALNIEYNNKIAKIKDSHFDKINSMIEDLYKVENFSKTKEVIFLKEKTDNRLQVSKILSDFDELITGFEPLLKERIKCYNIEIDNDYTFKAKCDIYSSMYEEDNIKGYNGTDDSLVGGTSISYANSFLNYIEKQSDKFTHINRQKVFTSEITLETPKFTNKTNFYLELKYNSNNLSL